MHFKKNIYITFIENSCKLKHVMMGRCIKYMNCVTFKRDICFMAANAFEVKHVC